MFRLFINFIILFLMQSQLSAQPQKMGNYAPVNGLKMYYEIHGTGKPLLLVHGGGSTINSSFGYWLPVLAKTHQVIAVEMQAHGRTADIDRPLSFEQDADDLAVLLKHLNISKTDVIGFSNGATTTMQLAIRHPELLDKIVLAAGNYTRDGMQPGMFDGFKNASIEMLPPELKADFAKVNPDPKALQAMFDRDVARMDGFKDIDESLIRAVKTPALIMNGDKDVVRNEHAVYISQLLPNAKLAILPGTHGEFLGDLASNIKQTKLADTALALIEMFLK